MADDFSGPQNAASAGIASAKDIAARYLGVAPGTAADAGLNAAQTRAAQYLGVPQAPAPVVPGGAPDATRYPVDRRADVAARMEQSAAGPLAGGDAPLADQPPPEPEYDFGGASGGQEVPAAWTPGSHQVQIKHGKPVPEEAKNAQALGTRLGLDAAGIERDVAIRKGQLDADYQTAKAGQLAKNAGEVAQLNRTRDTYVQNALKKQADLTQQIMAAKIDPDQWFNERGTAGAMAAIIGYAVGGINAARSGGQNQFLAQVNAQVDRNIRGQEANLHNLQGSLENHKNLLAQNLDAFGDRAKALLATRAQYMDIVQAQLDQRKAQLGTPEAVASWDKATKQLQDEKGKYLRDLADTEGDDVSEALTEKFVPAHTVGGTGGAGVSEADDARNVTMDGTTYQMPDAKEGADMRSKVVAAQEIQHISNEIAQLRSSGDTYTPWSTEDKTKAQTYAALLVPQYQMLHGWKRMTDADLNFVEKLGGDPTAWNSRSAQRFAIIAKEANGGVLRSLKVASARTIAKGYGHDKSGRTVPMQAYRAKDVASARMPAGFRPVGGGPAPEQMPAPVTKAYDPRKTLVPSAPGKGRKGGGRTVDAPVADDEGADE